MRLLLFMTASAALWAQGPNAEDLLKRSSAAGDANEPKVREYLYRQYNVTREINNKGEPSSRHTETWEAIELEGSEYRKLIQRDDKPLSVKDQKQEDDRLRKETEQRRKEKRGGIKNPLKRTYSMGYSKGDERFFDFRYAGEEPVNGRPAYVLEGTPKSGLKPANDHEKQLLLSHLKLWIDKGEFFESGFELEVVEPGASIRPGSRLAGTEQRMGDGTWLMSELRFWFSGKPARAGSAGWEMVITFSDFHKFAVDSRIVELR